MKATPKDRAVLGAFEKSTLLGIAGLQREGLVKLAHKAFIWGVYVAPEARGRGVGTLVLGATLDYAASTLGVRQVNLGVNTKNTAAVALYRKLGFEEYGLEREFLLANGEYYDEYQMVWRVRGKS